MHSNSSIYFLQKFVSNTEVLWRNFYQKINCGLHTACDHLQKFCVAAGGKMQHAM